MLKATGNANLPAAGWSNLSVYVPEYQRRQIKRTERFDLLEPYKQARIYREHMTEIGDRTVMLFRPAMMRDVKAANLWPKARAVWSQWEGYLKDGPGAKLKSDLADLGVPFQVIHTSGHASIADLKRLAAAIDASRLVPIHTFEGDRFQSYFSNVTRRQDGEWWEV
jgi:ribonuclease J